MAWHVHLVDTVSGVTLNQQQPQVAPPQGLLFQASNGQLGLSIMPAGVSGGHGQSLLPLADVAARQPATHSVVPVAGPGPGSIALAEAEARINGAYAAYGTGDYNGALALAAPVLLTQPNRVDLLLLLGAIHYHLRNYEQCIAFNNQCILLDPTLAEAHANMANAFQQLGNADMAVLYYQSALQFKPFFTDAYNNMASALVAKGLVPQAMEAYMAALRINPHLLDVHNNLGDLWRAQGSIGFSAAQQCYTSALSVSRGYAPAWRGLGDLYREAGEFTQAVAAYREAVQLRPNYADAYTGLAVVLKELKLKQEAEACFEKVVQLRPNCALAVGNLAGVYYEQGKLDAAIACYQRALVLEPNFPEAYNNLGNALREAGRSDEAIACYTACIQLQYSRTPLVANAGTAAEAAGGNAAGSTNSNAVNAVRNNFLALPAPPGAAAGAIAGALNVGALLGGGPAAVAAAQRLSVAYNNLGGCLKAQGQALAAIACYEQVVVLQPDSPEAAANLGSAYKDAARHDAAIPAYKRALTLKADFPEAFANLVHSMQCVCEWGDRAALFERLEAEVLRDLAAGRVPPVQPFHAMAYPFSAGLALAISRRYAEHCVLAASRLGFGALPHPPARPLALGRGERLKLAYVSSDFGNHPLSHLMGSVFGLHDRMQFEVYCYALSPSDNSEWRRRIEAEVEHFIDASAMGPGELAARISAEGTHIAVNLNGYTKGARNEVFALRPAPVQASYMGFPATLGADYVPYLITDKVVAPPHLHHCYSERLALMPHCYFVNDYKRAAVDALDPANIPRREDIGLPSDKVVFSCSNQLYKYDPETFATWVRILKRVPDSVLWLLRFPPHGEGNIRREAAAQGLPSERIIFTDVAAKDLHIRRSGLADVFLDTPLCNAHTTGCDVLWGGCPMVTLPLERMASRVAASLCYATGLGPEMVVSSQAEYEERAVELGLSPYKRASLRARLEAARLSCPLFDTDGWVRDLERVFKRMWEIHCEGRGPQGFELEPL